MIDYQVRLINFPSQVKEAVTENEDGTYTIFIDAALSWDEQRKRFIHAMAHILSDDFAHENVQNIEVWAHEFEEYLNLILTQ